MIFGTPYFPTRADALMRYYLQRDAAAEIDEKIANGEIHIGTPPKVDPTDEVFLRKDQNGARRWFIKTAGD